MKYYYLFIIAILFSIAANGQNVLLERQINVQNIEPQLNYFLPSERILFVNQLDSLIKIKIKDISLESKRNSEYEFYCKDNQELLGLFRDSILFLKTISYGNNITSGAFELTPFAGGIGRSWQTTLSLNGNFHNGFWYDAVRNENGIEVIAKDILSEKLIGRINYSGVDSIIRVWYKNNSWFGIFKSQKNKFICKYFSENIGWIPFPYPVNMSSRIYYDFDLINDSTFYMSFSDSLKIFKSSLFTLESSRNINESNDSIISIGNYSFFYDLDSLSIIDLDTNQNTNLLLPDLLYPGTVIKNDIDTGKFSTVMGAFKKSKDAFEFLNVLIKLLPGSKAVWREPLLGKNNGEFEVLGPQRVSIRSVKQDSSFLFENNISSKISSNNDFIPVPSLYVSIICKDADSRKSLPVRVSFYSISEDEILIESNVIDGKIHFVFPKTKKSIGLSVFSENHQPKSMRIHVENFKDSEELDYVLSLPKFRDSINDFVLNNITFEFDTYNLSNISKTELNLVRSWLDNIGFDTINIVGHCDSVGTVQYNNLLGLKRANEVLNYLKLNYNSSTVMAMSKGEDEPLVSNSTYLGRSVNRRVQFVIKIDKKSIKSSRENGNFVPLGE